MMEDISWAHQGGVAVLTVYLVDYLKHAEWFPWISNNTETLNRIVSLLISIGTPAGLRVAASATGGFDVHIPPIPILLDTFAHAAAQFGAQEILHKLLGSHQMTKQILVQLQSTGPTA